MSQHSAAGTTHRTPGDIERDIEATRARLAGTIDEISDRVKPANVVAELKEKARAQVVDEHGALRIERVGAAAAAAASAVGLVVLRAVRRK
ncbi:uncharacterized protein DUF3618 [Motilibacter rhizosphaerae]|uniref:Uncharacterized protein DUF3618 n=1 Tax=Motilibacter rhizosphaerae TaxID=598652 RepID=A0A4Q7NSV5_9ACTN|nr:DUF3618 domain-containing protein [Motilibacter rhizosphaerae]RZS89950.1 uncharacterized protein DUF3618 [Motilibacter rhizosphaerae]